jgi:hypothetical protein
MNAIANAAPNDVASAAPLLQQTVQLQSNPVFLMLTKGEVESETTSLLGTPGRHAPAPGMRVGV